LIVASLILNSIKKEPQFIEVITNRTKQSKIILNDSSMIYSNYGRKLIYLKIFAQDSRQIILEGEAFF